MRIGLIDVDAESRGKVTFPNLALMKLSAWHKAKGDHVEWYSPLLSGRMDVVYMSRVFGDEYTKDYLFAIHADRIVKGGSGYAISIRNGRECYCKARDPDLPEEVERMRPDYSIYESYCGSETAYGYLTKGCPRGCPFCHVAAMQGKQVRTVAHLQDFWCGQKYIKLLDPNLTASADWQMHSKALADSKAYVDFTQGLDVRLMTKEKIDVLNDGIRWSTIHFAWDDPNQDLRKHFERVVQHLRGVRRQTVSAYVLTNFGSTHAQDIERVMFLKDLNIQPYVMIYRKETAPIQTRKLQRYVNSPMIFWSVPSFSDYQKGEINR